MAWLLLISNSVYLKAKNITNYSERAISQKDRAVLLINMIRLSNRASFLLFSQMLIPKNNLSPQNPSQHWHMVNLI